MVNGYSNLPKILEEQVCRFCNREETSPVIVDLDSIKLPCYVTITIKEPQDSVVVGMLMNKVAVIGADYVIYSFTVGTIIINIKYYPTSKVAIVESGE